MPGIAETEQVSSAAHCLSLPKGVFCSKLREGCYGTFLAWKPGFVGLNVPPTDLILFQQLFQRADIYLVCYHPDCKKSTISETHWTNSANACIGWTSPWVLGVEALAGRNQERQHQVLSCSSWEAQHKTREEKGFVMSLRFWASGLIQGLAQLPAVTPSVAIAYRCCPQLPTSCYATQNNLGTKHSRKPPLPSVSPSSGALMWRG